MRKSHNYDKFQKLRYTRSKAFRIGGKNVETHLDYQGKNLFFSDIILNGIHEPS